jgi:hypothetical protein
MGIMPVRLAECYPFVLLLATSAFHGISDTKHPNFPRPSVDNWVAHRAFAPWTIGKTIPQLPTASSRCLPPA